MSSKPRRTVLSSVPLAVSPVQQAPLSEASHEPPAARRKAATVQQTMYLPPAVHEQLRELAFAERVKMHAILMEGLDLVFRARGLKSLSELTKES